MRAICPISFIVRYLIIGNNTKMCVNMSTFICEMEELKEKVCVC